MIKFKLSNFLDKDWTFENGCWRNGLYFIEPFTSPHIEHCFFFSEHKLIFVVREKNFILSYLSHFQHTSINIPNHKLNEIKRELESWDLEFIIIEIDLLGSNINVLKGRSNNIGIYYIFHENLLHGSWEIKDLYCYLNHDNLFNKLQLLKALTLIPTYTNYTIYKNIFLLSERSKLIYEGNNSPYLELPSNASIYHERLLKEEEKIYPVFLELIKNYVSKFSMNPSTFLGCELSGGLDSALVSIALTESHDRQTNTFSMLLPHEVGIQQQYRRQEIISKFNFIDHTIYAIDKGPLNSEGISLKKGIVSIYDENISRCFN